MHMTAPRRRLPPPAEHIRLRGRSTDLERPEEWERQDLEPRVLFVCFALERTADTDSHRELSRLPHPLSRSALLRVRDGYSSRFASLIFANLMTLVAASSDLTSLQTPPDLSIIKGPLYQRAE